LTQPLPVPRRRTPIADIFDEAFRLYGRNFVAMVALFGLFQIPLVVATLPFTLVQAEWSRRQWLTGTPAIDLNWLWPAIVVALLLSVLAVVLWTFAAAGVTYVAGRARSHGPPSIGAALQQLRRTAPSILGYCALLVGGWLVVVVAVAVVAVIAVAVADLQGGIGIAIVLTLLIGLAAVVAIVVVVTRLTLSVPVLMLEGEGPVGAVRRSWHLVSGSTWRTLGILVLAGAVTGVIGGVVSPAYLPGVFEGLMAGSLGSYVLVAVVGGVVQTLVGPILPVLMTVLYLDYSAEAGAPPRDGYPESAATTA
jgi:hypothetical protein